eukprot:4324290-Pleurochrysis_carterae.AAC.1
MRQVRDALLERERDPSILALHAHDKRMRAGVAWGRRRVRPEYAAQAREGANAWGARSKSGGRRYHLRPQWAAD